MNLLAKCKKCGAGGAVYGETSGEYINHISCSNVACGFRSEGDFIDDKKVFERWERGEGITLKDYKINFCKEFGLPTPDFSGRYWRDI